MVYVVNGVLARGVDMLLEKDFARFALQEMKIHPLMLLIQTLSMTHQTFSPTLYNPSTRHTRVSYVGTICTMVMIVHHGSRLSMSRNRATIKTLYSINHQPQSIQEDLNQQKMNDEFKIELKNELLNTMQSLCERILQQKQAANDSTIPLNEITSQIPPLTPVLPTIELEDSLIMGDENLSTILEKELDEFIKFSVEDLVSIPSKFEDTSDNDSECYLPLYDDFSPINVPEGKSVTFSNPLFDSNDNFTSSDDESLSDKDVSENNVKIYSNPLFEFDNEYISSDVNILFDEVLENIKSGGVDEIELLLHHNPSTLNISVASILEGFTDEPPLEENDDLFDLKSKENEWKKILYDATMDDLMTEEKVFNPGIHETFCSPTYVRLPFEDSHYLSLTYVIQIFLPYFTYPVGSPFLLSSGSKDIIFDPNIFAYSFYSLEPVAYESPMEICSSTCFDPNIMMIWGESS
ncbi:hypothetical protein Tco_1082010 [Tanacetum coccineum]|uniref:Uncharacterized protein n=1 Tax=Tanacetum coccineum TaxID=301880 RepID=A0ABQ5I0N2_9ASTR